MLNGGSAGTSNVGMHIGAIGGVHKFSPNFLVDGSIAVSRDPLDLIGADSGTMYGLDVLGIPGTNGPDVRYSGFPAFVVSGYETMGNSETYMPKYIRNTYFTYTLNFGLTKGAHEMRFGVDIARYRVNQWHPGIGGGPRGLFNFCQGITGLSGGPAANQFNAWAAFLLGLRNSMNKSQQQADTTPRQWLQGYYFRDRWQATRNLTLSLGLRWEYYPLMSRDHTGFKRYDPETNKLYIGGVGGVDQNAGITVSKCLFAPRVGVACRIGQKMVLRSGFGISINPCTLSTAESLLLTYPIAINNDYAGPNSYTAFRPIEQGIPIAPFLGANYNALQSRIDRQFSNGMLVKISYTWSRAMDFTDGEGGTLMWNDPTQLHSNYARAGYDRTYVFRAAWVRSP